MGVAELSDTSAPLVLTTLDGQTLYLRPKRRRTAGDLPGHEFHGNQWTDAQGGTHEDRRQRQEAGVVLSRASDVPIAVEHLVNKQKVGVSDKVAAKTIVAMGERSEHVNLQNMQTTGLENKNIFGPHASNLKRDEMPQLPEDHDGQMAFFKHLAENGVRMKIVSADPRELMATQAELDSVKVGQIYKYLLEHDGKLRGEVGPLFVSKEGAIIDGHHRWASVAAYSLTHPGTKVPVAVLNVPIKRALEISEAFGKQAGIEHQGFTQGFKAAAGQEEIAPKVPFKDIDVSEPPPDAPPKPDDIHPWNWINGRWVYIPTDTADGVPPSLDLRTAGDYEGHPFHGNQYTDGQGGAKTDDGGKGKDSTSPAAEKFNTYFKEKGYKVAQLDDIGDEGKKSFADAGLTLRPATQELPGHVLQGVDEGIQDVDKTFPGLHMKENVRIVVADYAAEQGAPAASALTTPKGAFMLINSNPQSMTDFRHAGSETFTIAGRRAKELGLTGEERERAMFRDVVVHESGHFVDALTGDGLTNMTIDSLLLSLPNATEDAVIPKWLDKHVSTYAAAAGPHEAAAEIWTAVVRDYKLPRELDFMKDRIKGAFKRAT